MVIVKGGVESVTGAMGRQKAQQEKDILRSTAMVGGIGVTTGVTTYAVAQSFNSQLGGYNTKNMFTNIMWVMYGLTRYYFGNMNTIKPAAVIAGFPLPTVDELSHAMSNRILKYRATGGIFLAHQEGGDQTLRIVGKAYGENRFMFLQLLDFLFLYGGARKVDYFSQFIKSLLPATTLPSDFETGKLNFEREITPSPWRDFNNSVVGGAMGELHYTFPVITRNRIYTNMYIETYEYTESVEHGLNCVEYSIFFRKYVPERKRQFILAVDPSSQDANKDKQIWYREDVDDKLQQKTENLELMLDLGYSVAMLLYRFITLSTEGSLSYAENIATSFGLGLRQDGVDSELLASGVFITAVGIGFTLLGSI